MTDFADRPFKERALSVIDCAWGGEHHVKKIKWELRSDGCSFPSCCEFLIYSGMATFDFAELTRLVVAAHDHCVRADVRPAMRYLKVMLSDRKRTHPGHPMVSAHPTLEDHVAYIHRQIDGHELSRRLGYEPTAVAENKEPPNV